MKFYTIYPFQQEARAEEQYDLEQEQAKQASSANGQDVV